MWGLIPFRHHVLVSPYEDPRVRVWRKNFVGSSLYVPETFTLVTRSARGSLTTTPRWETRNTGRKGLDRLDGGRRTRLPTHSAFVGNVTTVLDSSSTVTESWEKKVSRV